MQDKQAIMLSRRSAAADGRRRASDKHRRPTAHLGKQAASKRRNL